MPEGPLKPITEVEPVGGEAEDAEREEAHEKVAPAERLGLGSGRGLGEGGEGGDGEPRAEHEEGETDRAAHERAGGLPPLVPRAGVVVSL